MSISLRPLSVALVLVTWLAGCSGADDAVRAGCAENQQNACPCFDGHQGVQTCHDGAYSACSCQAGSQPVAPSTDHGQGGQAAAQGQGGQGQGGQVAAQGQAGQAAAQDKGSLSSSDIESFCQSTYQTFSRLAEQCCTAGEKKAEVIFEHTEIDRVREQFCVSLLTQSQAAGRITFDLVKVTACAEAQQQRLASATCDQLLDPDLLNHQPPADCLDAVEGLNHVGQACLRDHECADGLTCVSFGLSTDGTCQVPSSTGLCSFKFPKDDINLYVSFKGTYPEFGHHPACSAGSYCEMDDSSVGSLCRPHSKAGEVCNGSPSGSPTECGDGLFCEGGGWDSKCSKITGGKAADLCALAGPCVTGDYCPSTMPCQAGFYCGPKSNSSDFTCHSRKAAGASCSGYDGECQGFCVSGTCVEACPGT